MSEILPLPSRERVGVRVRGGGPERGYRVLRGGSWNNNDNNNRCANRNNNNPNNNWNNNGFRIARKSADAGACVFRIT